MKVCNYALWSGGWLLAMVPFGVLGQGNSAVMQAPAKVLDSCKRDVMKYQSNIDLVRKSLGDKAAAIGRVGPAKKPEPAREVQKPPKLG